MDYQVWIKDLTYDMYIKVDCGDLAAAKRLIDEAVRKGGEPILTVEVPYSLAIKVEEPGAEKPPKAKLTKKILKLQQEEKGNETNQSETEPGESSGD